jgi:aspartokinase-like uncharacterized kinase
MIVVKVGGSLFDLPGLGPRLAAWLAALDDRAALLVPGGGPTADVIRRLDATHRLGEERSHWLALRAMTLNAHALAGLLPAARVVADLDEAAAAWRAGAVAVLDAHAFLLADEGRPGALPHSWDVTSDAVAARVAVVAGAARLALLKSTDVPEGIGWEEAARLGLVDRMVADVLRQAPGMSVWAVNFRASVCTW